MTRSERAKLFMPFDAMKGLRAKLADREERHLREPKRLLSDETKERIGKKIMKISRGDRVRVVFYSLGHETTVEGTAEKPNIEFKFIIVDGSKIFFEDIYSISIVK